MWAEGGALPFQGVIRDTQDVLAEMLLQLTALAMAGMKACSDLTLVTRPWL